MSRRAAVVVVLIGGLATVGGFIIYRSRSTTVKPPEQIYTQPVSVAPGGPTPLPDSFESPGLVSRRDGPLRIYVAVPREVALSKRDGEDTSQPEQTLQSVPIVVVIENDSYKKLDAAADLSVGEELFTLIITRDGPQGVEVFSHREPRAEVSAWQPAERKTFTVSWPSASLSPGEYLVSVRPAFGTKETVRIRTTIR